MQSSLARSSSSVSFAFGGRRTTMHKIRDPKLAAGLVIVTLLLSLAPTLFTGLTDTHDWFQFVVSTLVYAFVAFWAFRFHALRIPRVLRVDGVAATATGWLCVGLSLVSGSFAVVVFIRWFYS